MEAYAYLVLAALFVLTGLAGTVIPVIPGAILIFAGLFLAAWAEGFAYAGPVALTIIGILGALMFVMDFMASTLGAQRLGASPKALAGATLGALAGMLFGIPGLILGPFVGAVAGEYWATRGLRQSARVGFGTWIGLLLGAVVKVILGFLMVATYFAFRSLA
jgi:uncharacterized protein YqgC (DUF456 family)